MNEKNELIVSLLHKIMNGVTLTDSEEKELNSWMKQSHHNRILYNEIMNSETFRQDVRKMLSYDGRAIWKKITRQIHPQQPKNNLISFFHDRPFIRYAAAAVLLISISTVIYFMFVNSAHHQSPVTSRQSPVSSDVAPGTEKAVLILADGTSIVLDNTANGEIARQGNTTVLKKDGLLAYNPDNNKPQAKPVYNTIKTNKGQHFSSLLLADGSKIWLNAASSIRFPTSFTGKEREVEITGQAYFEVAKNAAMPFIVNVLSPFSTRGEGQGMRVQVLGTHFDINAYTDEAAIKTTLLEGAVKITANRKSSFLKPGQQALLPLGGDTEGVTGGDIKIINDADLDEAVAWKNGSFQFQNADIQSIMRQVEKWYDVEVVYEGNTTRRFFVDDIPRSVPVSTLLSFLEKTGWVNFKIEGNPPAGRAGKITVIPVNK